MSSPIKTAAHHEKILDRVSAIIDLDPILDSAEGKELEALTVLLKAYESRVFPLAPLREVDARRQ